MKICKGCKENKPLSEYHKDNKDNKGLKSRCKICRSKEEKKRYYKDHEETKRKARAAWHKDELKKILKEREI